VLKDQEDSFVINEDENEDVGITPHERKYTYRKNNQILNSNDSAPKNSADK
jgi:hypothetical protein